MSYIFQKNTNHVLSDEQRKHIVFLFHRLGGHSCDAVPSLAEFANYIYSKISRPHRMRHQRGSMKGHQDGAKQTQHVHGTVNGASPKPD